MLPVLARASAQLARRTSAQPSARGLASAAKVVDARVSCTFIMAKQKQKVTVPGMVGWTLLETAKHHGLLPHSPHAEPPWDYITFGEGPMSAEDHVVVSAPYFDKTGPIGYQEANVLNQELIEGELTPTSRLAACVTLTKELDGITVIVPDTNLDMTNYM